MRTAPALIQRFKRPGRTIVLLGFFAFANMSCGNKYTPEEEKTVKNLMCKSSEKVFSYEEVVYDGQRGRGRLSYNDVRDSINSACMTCHQAPSRTAGFTYIDSYRGEVRTIDGKTEFYPGYFEIAEKTVEALNHPDLEKKRMPPKDRRIRNPASFTDMSKKIQAWINAGKPNGSFSLDPNAPPEEIRKPRTRSSETGECTPSAKIIGFDYGTDRRFANMTELPKDLSETDLTSLDAYELAKKGTLAYNVEYPLWADNNGKGRWIHVPMKYEGLRLVQQKITYKPDGSFDIPENTRFYKTFYKKTLMPNGRLRYRRVETRLIVVRYPSDKVLLGTYKWDESEQTATLVETPYQDGTPFRDTSFKLVVDEATRKEREYVIPARHRCVECHMGSLQKNFILGFTPLQINRRNIGEGGREEFVSQAELSQLQRFIDYGMFENAPPKAEWPVLQKTGNGSEPRNVYELRAQGYVTGNCAHCHNPNGFAFTPQNGVTLELTPGSLFQFNTKIRSTQLSRQIVHQNGDLDQSHIWRKISDSDMQLGMMSQMPMNTAGGPDCKALRSIGKWIRSFESLAAAEAWEPTCKKENEPNWLEFDPTYLDTGTYVPRRNDWDKPGGMPEKFRNLKFSDELKQAITTQYAVGYWSSNESCQFPEKTLKPEEIRPWMMRGSEPKRPFGELYYTTPGSWYFRTSCMKCHGEKADADSGLARGIAKFSRGTVKVANFMKGMFGNNGENLNVFQVGNENLGPNYLIWMAMEGTKVQFPPQLSSFLGRHGGQMLNQMREKCLKQISPAAPSSPRLMEHEIFEKVCFIGNRAKDDPLLQYNLDTNEPLHPEAIEEWADKAAYNIGFAVFDFLKNAGSGHWLPGNEQCEKVYPKKENP